MVYLNSDVKFSEDVLNLIKFTIEKVDLHAQIVSDILKIWPVTELTAPKYTFPLIIALILTKLVYLF